MYRYGLSLSFGFVLLPTRMVVYANFRWKDHAMHRRRMMDTALWVMTLFLAAVVSTRGSEAASTSIGTASIDRSTPAAGLKALNDGIEHEDVNVVLESLA